MSIVTGELADWPKAPGVSAGNVVASHVAAPPLYDFVFVVSPFSHGRGKLVTRRKRSGQEGGRDGDEVGYFRNVGSQEWAGVDLMPWCFPIPR